jgi:MFS family permease
MEVVIAQSRKDGWVIGLISAGHFLSHFYYLTLPPMFPLLKAEFSVSYVELGLAMTAYALLGGLIQVPVGFLVDHLFGARKVLLAGLGLTALAVTLIGFVHVYWALLVLAVIAGIGNSVFHPADYTILSSSIGERRLGRAFSIHTFFGFLGTACAPPVMLALSGWLGWRLAFIGVGLIGSGVCAAMALRGRVLEGEAGQPRTEAPAGYGGLTERAGLRLLMSAPVILFLVFFTSYGMASGGLSAFTVSALIDLHGLPLDWANTALTGLLFGVVGGVLLAGFLADRFNRHGVMAAVALIVSMGFVLLPAAMGLPGAAMTTVMVVVGLGMGGVLPPRDLMVRALTPPGQTGKVFGFVFVGFSIGIATSPLLFGWLLDTGRPGMIFTLSALFLLMALASIAAAQRVAARL